MVSVEKIKVVWLCHFSNSFVHEKLELRYDPLIKMIRKLARKSVSLEVPEFAKWITNGINEFEKFDNVELHIVSPYPHLKARIQEFIERGIHYHFFQNQDDSFGQYMYKTLVRPKNCQYSKNCKLISKIVNTIHPDIVHLFGAENPHYALGVHWVNRDAVSIAQLQTLMNTLDFRDNYPIDERSYNYRSSIEKSIIREVDFLATPSQKYRDIIQREIKPNAVFLNIGLVLKDPVVTELCEKKFDFVYFAANISKAADLAVEAFAIAQKSNPNITLDIIGGYSEKYKIMLDGIIEKYDIKNAITFEGCLPTHDDVLRQIRLSRFALLPLRIDLTSGTIREAMSNGLPVVTTDTGELGTQQLNKMKQNVLVSPIGNHQALAENMIQLLENEDLAETLRQNAFQTRLEASSNESTVRKYVAAYKACLNFSRNHIPMPTSLTDI